MVLLRLGEEDGADAGEAEAPVHNGPGGACGSPRSCTPSLHEGVGCELQLLLEQHAQRMERHMDEALATLRAELVAHKRLGAPRKVDRLPSKMELLAPVEHSTARRPSISNEKSAPYTSTGSWRPLQSHQSSRRGSLELPVGQERPRRRRWSEKVVASGWFEAVCCSVIISNAIFFGIEAQYLALVRPPMTPLLFDIMSLFFTLWFMFELILRMAANIRAFFFSVQRLWNVVDVILVLVSLFELMLQLLDIKGGVNLAHLRIVRVARAVRIFRIVRVLKIFTSLRVLIYSVLSTLRSLFWTMALLMIVLYLFGILFTQANLDASLNEDQKSAVDHYFGSLLQSVYSLFKSVTGGLNWQDCAGSLGLIHPAWEAVFFVFLAFTYFAVLNVITGMFCQTAIETANRDKDMVVKTTLSMRQHYIQELVDLFKSMDSAETGLMTLSMIEDGLQDPQMQAYFNSLEITADDAWNLFHLLDFDQSGVIDLEEFVLGCLRLRGSARSIDIHMLMYETQWSMKKISEMHSAIQLLLSSLAD